MKKKYKKPTKKELKKMFTNCKLTEKELKKFVWI